jgi:UDP-glucose 4-epimerase
MMNRLIVTGANGFIGGHLVTMARDQGYAAWGVDRNGSPPMGLPSPKFVQLVRQVEPHVLIHAAGSSSVQESLADPSADFRDNVLATQFVLETLRKHAPNCRFIYLSSAAVYGGGVACNESDQPNPVSPYGVHKMIAETLAVAARTVFAQPTLRVRPFSVYGPGLKRQLLWDIARQILETGSAKLFGDGSEIRDFVHVQDVCRSIMSLVENAPFAANVCNINSGEGTSIRQIATLLAGCLHGRVEFTGVRRAGDPLALVGDGARYWATPDNDYDVVNLLDGVTEYAAWARQQFEFDHAQRA